MFSSQNSQVSNDANYIEDVFSTYLYTGTGSTQTITNGIDLSTKGGLVWFKRRNTTSNNRIYDTARGMVSGTGGSPNLYTNDTAGNLGTGFDASVTSTTTGFNIAQGGIGDISDSGGTYASWTFRKQKKFFDVVTYTGNGQTNGAGPDISHSLGSKPGFMIIKCTSAGSTDWIAVARNTDTNYYTLRLNTTDAELGGNANNWMTSTTFNPSKFAQFYGAGPANTNGATYVAYLFAHDAGGFGLTGTDNVISCGSYTGNGSATGPTISLGYEPQWLLVKNTTSARSWFLVDNMRGLTVGGVDPILNPNTSGAELSSSSYNYFSPTATGFSVTNSDGDVNASGDTYIYIAIRRGPMKVPTDATKVYNAVTGTFSAGDSLSVGFPADMYIDAWRTGTLYKANYSRLVNFANSNSSASQNYLKTNTTDAEITTSQAPSLYNLWNTTANVGSWNAGVSEVWWMFRRAPSFFDEVCYTGTGSALNVTHNLGVVPELMIVKNRTSAYSWSVYSAALGNTQYLFLNSTNAAATDSGQWSNTTPTSTVFTVNGSNNTGTSGQNFVAYLFATCAGVSKVGSYTGTGTTLQVNCGFTGGARFVLIKRTDSTGDWYVWDTARGIVSGNDPYLLLNSTAAEVTNTDYIDTYSAGFEISSTAPAAINASGGTFIFLAIA